MKLQSNRIMTYLISVIWKYCIEPQVLWIENWNHSLLFYNTWKRVLHPLHEALKSFKHQDSIFLSTTLLERFATLMIGWKFFTFNFYNSRFKVNRNLEWIWILQMISVALIVAFAAAAPTQWYSYRQTKEQNTDTGTRRFRLVLQSFSL